MLIKWIQDGEFINISKLTIDHLSTLLREDTSKVSNSKRPPLTSIIKLTQCFTNYIAILGQSYLWRNLYLLGYQHLILEAHLEYSGDGWAVYDHRFLQIAATLPGSLWALRDGDLWKLTFSQWRQHCHHCFNSTHLSEQCSGPQIPHPERELLHHDSASQEFAVNGTIYLQCSFLRCHLIHACRLASVTYSQGTATTNVSTAQGMPSYSRGLQCALWWGPHTNRRIHFYALGKS